MNNIARTPFQQESFKPLFSGHETFPLRYGWLKKAYDAVAQFDDATMARGIFLNEDAIARFGVGKNMVASMRHWATCCGVLRYDEQAKTLTASDFGHLLFGTKGLDPYLEHPASLWLLHWQLATYAPDRPTKTTWYWTFNHFPALDFARVELVDGLMRLAETHNWSRLAEKTLRNDVDCLIRTYEARDSDGADVEDLLASPLSELGLIRGQRNHFRLIRDAKRSLPNAVFVSALNEFWNSLGAQRTLSFEAIAHEPGSPGRVFLLDEADLADRLLALDDLTGGLMRWSETAGLKQVLRENSLTRPRIEGLLRKAYQPHAQAEAA